ncbi:MAG: hypothetical protein ISS92_01280 [Candidatus Omnitrophica bacterium]|nr:hypothetical protein [Candidatus Omnitrophota bacterium]
MTGRAFRAVFIAILLTIAIASTVTVLIFNSTFAHNTIDYLSFFAALFLIADGFFKIRRYKNEPYFPNQLIRHLRIIIGTCIFTIHVMQYVYGI